MKPVIKKEFLYQLLFFACIAVPYLNNYEVIFSVWSLTAIITLRKKYSLTIIHYVSCFAAIFLIAFVVSFFNEFDTYDFVRDIAYMLKPIIGLLAGYQLCKDYIKNPMKLVVTTGFVIAVLHLSIMCYSVAFLRITSMQLLRQYSGYFSDFEVYAIIILIFSRQFGVQVSRRRFRIYLVILSVSIFFYLARTNFIQFVVLYMALKGYFIINRRSVTILASTVLIIGIGYAAIYYYNPVRNGKGIDAFLYKVKNSPIEPFKTRVRAGNWKDFNDNYRSYENILTLRQVSGHGTSALLFGEGLGSSIDLKRKVWLQSSYMRYIPFLHNGFMTVLLKSGILGNLFLIYSIAFFFRYKRSNNSDVQNINYLLLGSGVFLIMSYWVFMGLYFVPDTKSVLLGFLIRHREIIIAKLTVKEEP